LLRAYLSEFTGASTRKHGSNGGGGSDDDEVDGHDGAEEDDDVVLAILTNAYHSSGDFEAQVERFISTDSYLAGRVAEARPIAGARGRPLPKVVFLARVAQSELPSVYQQAHAFVLPSRGEGWGRPHVEAMAMGLPVVATNWSGPTEYLTERNGYPLPLDDDQPLVQVREGAFKGHLWANPSVRHLRALLRDIKTNPSKAKAKGLLARREMVEKYSPAVLGQQVKSLLRELEDDKRRYGPSGGEL